MLHSCERSILRKIPVLPIEKFCPLVLSRSMIMLQHLKSFNFHSIICLLAAYRRLKTKEKYNFFKLLKWSQSIGGSGRLQDVSNMVIWLGRWGEVICTCKRWLQKEVWQYSFSLNCKAINWSKCQLIYLPLLSEFVLVLFTWLVNKSGIQISFKNCKRTNISLSHQYRVSHESAL